MNYKALTLWQPWASLMVRGLKTVETPLIELTDTEEKAFGIWEPGRFAWYSCGSQVLRSPVKCRGGQTFWHPPIEVAEQVTKQVEGDR